jgi:hypothetical protein
MSNTLITPNWVLKRVGKLAINNLKFANNVDRSYDDEFVQSGAKVGDTINLRLPQQYQTTKGQAFQQQAVTDRIVPVTLTDQANVGISFSSFQMTVDVDDYMGRYIEPAGVQLANTMDLDGLTRVAQQIYNVVGTPGTLATDNATYLAANTLLSGLACPPERFVITSPDQQAAITAANFALFNPTNTIGDSFETGVYSSNTLGFRKWFWDQNVANHTNGNFIGTPLVMGANQTGSTITIDGFSGGATVRVGDRFTMGASAITAASTGVFFVNPQNYQGLRSLGTFVVTAPATESGGAMTINISPSIITAGQLQSVTASPVDNAVVTFIGAASAVGQQAIAWTKQAAVMVMADLVMPEGGAIGERISSKPLGFALRFVKQFNILSDQNLARVDCLYGWRAYRPEWMSIIYG